MPNAKIRMSNEGTQLVDFASACSAEGHLAITCLLTDFIGGGVHYIHKIGQLNL